MDPVSEIKTRLTIEELVGQYCQLKKKGRTFMALCPFHNDSKPSLQVSPEKGIAYCFACQTGGDIFSFYQAIEGVEFRQALKDLAEKTGVTIEHASREPTIKKDEKQRIRACLEAAQKFYETKLKENEAAKDYLKGRGITGQMAKEFGMGYAPDSFSDTYQHLLKKEFSRKEILAASLGVQKDLAEEKIYDRFRHRVMFPIHSHSGDIVGFGGRTIGADDAKYINSSEGPLYNKSQVLYGLHRAKEAARESKRLVMVEGYFDVLACHSIGMTNVVAVSGTALTEQHVKVLKRYCDTVVLCLDQDRAGRDAAERSFLLCEKEGLSVHAVKLLEKDPDEAVQKDPEAFKKTLEDGGVPYFDLVFDELKELDLSSAETKRDALRRLMPLLDALPTSVEREHELVRAASVFSTTETALKEDLEQFTKQEMTYVTSEAPAKTKTAKDKDMFSTTEISLGILLHYPFLRSRISELIEPDEGFAGALYEVLKEGTDINDVDVLFADLPEEFRERASILHLYCEHHEFMLWSNDLATREWKGNCLRANREILRTKQMDISRKLLEAHREGRTAEEAQLSTQYQQVLKLAKMAV